MRWTPGIWVLFVLPEVLGKREIAESSITIETDAKPNQSNSTEYSRESPMKIPTFARDMLMDASSALRDGALGDSPMDYSAFQDAEAQDFSEATDGASKRKRTSKVQALHNDAAPLPWIGDDANLSSSHSRDRSASSIIQTQLLAPIPHSRGSGYSMSEVAHMVAFGVLTRDLGSAIVTLFFWLLLFAAFAWWARKVKLQQRYREIIPHLGKILLAAGLDPMPDFELKMVLHEVSYKEQLTTYIKVEASFNEHVSEEAKMGPSQYQKGAMAACFHDALSIIVPQGCTTIKFKLLDKDRKTPLAEGSSTVEKIMDVGEEDLVVPLIRKAKGKKTIKEDPRLTITCYAEGASDNGGSGNEDAGPPPHELLMHGLDVSVFSLELKLEIDKFSKKRVKEEHLTGPYFTATQMVEHQLGVLAHVCQGKLTNVTGFFGGGKQRYFCIFRDESSSSVLAGWKFAWWDRGDKPKDPNKEEPENAIPILYIGKIYADPNKSDEFTVEYVKKTSDLEPSTLVLSRVDRSREIWVESLSIFINQLRKARSGEIRPEGEPPGGKRDSKRESSHGDRKSSRKSKAATPEDSGQTSDGEKSAGFKKKKSSRKSHVKGDSSEDKSDDAGEKSESFKKKKSSRKSTAHSKGKSDDEDDGTASKRHKSKAEHSKSKSERKSHHEK